MARETKFKEIDGVDYECRMMPATVGQKTLMRLLEVIGRPALVTIATGFGDQDSGIEKVADIGSLLLMQSLTPDSSDEVLMTLLDGVRCEDGDLNDRKVFDKHFAGKIKSLYAVAVWSVQVNYEDFFDAARSMPVFQGLIERAEKALQVLTVIMKSGISSSQGTPSTSETSSPSKQH